MFYQISGFADEYSAKIEEQLDALKKLNVKFIELRVVDGKNTVNLNENEVKELKEKLDNAGVAVSAIGSPLGKISLDDDFDTHIKVAKRAFATAKALNCKFVRVFSFYLGERPLESCFDMVCERLAKLLDLADEYDVTLCLENEANLYGEAPEHCLELLEHFNGKLRCVFDMGNFRIGGYNPKKAYKLLKQYIEYFHIKDSLKDKTIVPCGEGDAKIKQILKKYKKDFPKKQNIYLSSEPHLVKFIGIKELTNQNLKTKYHFESNEEAYIYAHQNLEKITGNL